MIAKKTSRKSLAFGLLVVTALVVLIGLGILAVLVMTNNNAQKLAQVIDDNTVTLSSDLGHFSIELPGAFTMKQAPERKQVPNDPDMSEYLLGEVVFQQSIDSSPESNRITVSYGKPEILGKGGSCVGNDGELAAPGYVSAVVAGSTMTVCRNNFEMTAAYPKHATKEIEYVITIQASEQTMFDTLSRAVAGIKWSD